MFPAKKASGKIEPGDATHGKINQVLAGAVDLVAITSHGGKAIENGAKAFNTEIRFDGLGDLVSKVVANLEIPPYPPKKIGYLHISSHGTTGYMSFSSARDLKEDLILAQYAHDDVVKYGPTELAYQQDLKLAPLRLKFVRWAVVTLSACEVAGVKTLYDQKTKAELYKLDGRNFLKAVSKALGNIAVQGGASEQNDIDYGMEGSCYRCDSHACAFITEKTANFFGPNFSITDEFGQHYLDDTLAEDTLAAIENLPLQHPEKQGLLRKLFKRRRQQ